jgi:hypothetical protein
MNRPADAVTYRHIGDRCWSALAGCDDAQITHAVTRIARLGQATINPIGLLVDRARAGDPFYLLPPAPAVGEDDPHVVEPPPELWSAEPALAPALAARTALEAARSPLPRVQLAARQAALEGPQGGGDGTGGGQQAA